MALPGGTPERLTTDSSDDFFPAPSPDGREVAFHSWRGGLARHLGDAARRRSGPAGDLLAGPGGDRPRGRPTAIGWCTASSRAAAASGRCAGATGPGSRRSSVSGTASRRTGRPTGGPRLQLLARRGIALGDAGRLGRAAAGRGLGRAPGGSWAIWSGGVRTAGPSTPGTTMPPAARRSGRSPSKAVRHNGSSPWMPGPVRRAVAGESIRISSCTLPRSSAATSMCWRSRHGN